MSVLEAILLGLLQGVAEFLPISSSGHLALAQKLLGLEEVPLLFDVFLHLATLAAVCLFFRKKIAALFQSFWKVITRQGADENDSRYILAVILATLVTGILGIFVEKVLPEMPIQVVFAGFIFTAFLLLLSSLIKDRKGRKDAAPSWRQALLIGLAQGVGTLPGVSRSGSTISGARFCGVTRELAGEFSFIVSIPAILGAFLLELKDLGELGSAVGILPLIAGCITAFVSGLFALAWLMKLIRKGKLGYFALYLIPLGIFGLLFVH